MLFLVEEGDNKAGIEADNSPPTQKDDDGILGSKDDPVQVGEEDGIEDQDDDTNHEKEDDDGDGDDDYAPGHGSAPMDGTNNIAVEEEPVKVVENVVEKKSGSEKPTSKEAGTIFEKAGSNRPHHIYLVVRGWSRTDDDDSILLLLDVDVPLEVIGKHVIASCAARRCVTVTVIMH